MKLGYFKKLFCWLVLTCVISANVLANNSKGNSKSGSENNSQSKSENSSESNSENPCSSLLSILDRPTVANSPCVVPFAKALLESGFQYQELRMEDGNQQNYPAAQIRIGLPANTEINAVLPNHIHQSIFPHSGYKPTIVGIKHQLGYTKNWVGAVETLFTLPSGSAEFGSKGLGGTVNGIMSYDVNEHLELSFMFGVSSLTAPRSEGGERFTSFNPDFVVVVPVFIDKLDFYSEVYGQTKTGPHEETGFNMDAGVVYLLLKNLTLDVEYGQHLSGTLEDFEHYVGAGVGVLF